MDYRSSTRRRFIETIALGFLGCFTCPRQSHAQRDVCDNRPLVEALRVLHRACTAITCDFSTLHVLGDSRYRDALLAAFANGALNTVHVFFPENRWELRECFDWEARKRSQLDTFEHLNNAEESTVYLIGRSSTTGSIEHNRHLSAARIQSVYNYLRYELQIPCRDFRGAWLGEEILPFTTADAAFLGLEPLEYRGDELVLNQAVHVFAVPCGNLDL